MTTMVTGAALSMLLFSFGGVHAQDAQMDACMRIADSLKRLDCFEKLARDRNDKPHANPAVPAEASQGPDTHPTVRPLRPDNRVTAPAQTGLVPGKSTIERWQVRVSLDPIQGGADVVLRNKAVKGRNQFAVPVELRLHCQHGRAGAELLWREPMVRGEIPLLLLDGRNVGEASTAWAMDEKGENWRYVGDFPSLLQALAGHRQAHASVEVMEENINFEDDVIHASFDLTGAELAFAPLRKACF